MDTIDLEHTDSPQCQEIHGRHARQCQRDAVAKVGYDTTRTVVRKKRNPAGEVIGIERVPTATKHTWDACQKHKTRCTRNGGYVVARYLNPAFF